MEEGVKIYNNIIIKLINAKMNLNCFFIHNRVCNNGFYNSSGSCLACDSGCATCNRRHVLFLIIYKKIYAKFLVTQDLWEFNHQYTPLLYVSLIIYHV